MEKKNKILTIPNLLSLFRILLIPLIVWLYCVKGDYIWTCVILILSGLTDTVDGWIARRFDMTSNIGIVLDPVADKMTQATIIFCLTYTFPVMRTFLLIFLVTEVILGLMGLVVMKANRAVYSAKWYGKITTWLLYVTAIVHVLFPGIPHNLSLAMVCACIAVLLFSLVSYAVRYAKLIREHRNV